ncbi:hypothetical protein [Saccharothrix texasensis]|uniref:Uncharacterized protein n=1 Tax=Saccharothrix texasensis TaxID=103734 RepID=A0A3N1GX08_9PSEU|nr:hypothetical protein [Saccharothrix texasensis]ROP34833.1 hypothetical protein EDD40_0037 [Saccharothrix texasensis]
MARDMAVGGILLDVPGPTSFPWSVPALIVLVLVLVVVVLGSRHAFPATRPGTA